VPSPLCAVPMTVVDPGLRTALVASVGLAGSGVAIDVALHVVNAGQHVGDVPVGRCSNRRAMRQLTAIVRSTSCEARPPVQESRAPCEVTDAAAA
jgi:hypothetical protein